MDNLNPELHIIKITHNNIKFNLIQDGDLIGGTKQRLLEPLLRNSKCTEFVYAGPVYGFAQIALSYMCNIFNKKATIFIERMVPRWHLTEKAMKYNPNLKLIEIPRPTNLKKIQNIAHKYVTRIQAKKGNNYICYLSFGLKDDADLLISQISQAVPKKLIKNPPQTMWLVAGSATLLSALYKVFPNAFFNVVQVGKTIWPDQLELDRTRLFISPQGFEEIAKMQPPYETVATYDAKLWEFFVQYGKNDDYIWNVGKDAMIINASQKRNNNITFPYFIDWMPVETIHDIIDNIKHYNYKDNIVSYENNDMIMNRKIDYYKYNILANIFCEKCVVLDKISDLTIVEYFYKNKNKIMKNIKYKEPNLIRKYLFSKRLEKYPYNITYYICVLSFLNIDSIFDSDICYGEAMIVALILDKKYSVLLNNPKCSINMYSDMLAGSASVCACNKQNIIFCESIPNAQYDALFVHPNYDIDNINNILISNKFTYIIYFANDMAIQKIPNYKYFKTIIFADQNMRDFEYANIYINKN